MKPEQPADGRKSDYFICIPIESDVPVVLIFQYDLMEWTQGGGDIQRVRRWMPIPPVTRMFNCDGPQIPITTNGETEWVNCPICGKTWDMKTLRELPMKGETK